MSLVIDNKVGTLKTENDGPQISIVFHNNSSSLINLSWINRTGDLVDYGALMPGASRTQGTSVNHPWFLDLLNSEEDYSVVAKADASYSVYISDYEVTYKASTVTQFFSDGWSSIWGYGVPRVTQALGLDSTFTKLDETNPKNNNKSLNYLEVPAAWEAGLTGKGVKVAILDEGVWPHDEITVGYSKDLIDGDSDTTAPENRDQLHGQGIAAVIAAKNDLSDSKETDITGVAPDVELIDIRIAGGPSSTMAEGIRHATDQGARLIHISQQNKGTVAQVVLDAVEYAYANGALVIWCAGNFGQGTPTGPASSAFTGKALAVGNMNLSTGLPFSDSNKAGTYPMPFVFAPSGGYYPTYDNEYRFLGNGGTSFSSPYVTGIAALIIEQNPEITVDELITKITASSWIPTIGKDVSFNSSGNKLVSLNTLADSELNSNFVDYLKTDLSSNSGKISRTLTQDSSTLYFIDNSSGNSYDLSGIERLGFLDKSIAFDLEGNSGDALEIIHALTGYSLLNDLNIRGTVIAMLDKAADRNSVVKTAIDAVLGVEWNKSELVDLLLSNIYDIETNSVANEAVQTLVSGMSPYEVFWAAAESEEAQANIGLVGFVDTGLEYIV